MSSILSVFITIITIHSRSQTHPGEGATASRSTHWLDLVWNLLQSIYAFSSVGLCCISGSREKEQPLTGAAVGSRRDSAPQVGDIVQESEELGSSGLEAEVSLSARNWLRVQTESVRALSGVETCYFSLSTLFDCDSLRPFSNDWVYLTPTRRQRSSSLGTGSMKVSAFLSSAAPHSPLIHSFILEH